MAPDDTQPVADETDVRTSTADDTAAKSGPEGTGARNEDDDLDALLAQYEIGSTDKSSQPDTKAETKGGEPAADERLARLERELAERNFREEITPIVNTIRGGIPKEVWSDSEIEAWLEGQARDDARIASAWQRRRSDPQTFQKIVGQLGRRFAGKFKSAPDAKATEDRDAVAAAVRGSGNKAPEGQAPAYGGMPNGEFADQVHKAYGFRPPV